MTAIFRTDEARSSAAELRRLLIRLLNGEGEDRDLGADVREALGVPSEAGDPTGCMDCAYALVKAMRIDWLETFERVKMNLRDRARTGWNPPDGVTNADVARAITIVVVKCEIARLEGTPV